MKKLRAWIVAIVTIVMGVAWAATYTVSTSVTARSGRTTARYQRPYEGLVQAHHTTDDVNDVTVTLDSRLTGYLQRVVTSSDGNDAAWTLTVSDAQGVPLLSESCNMSDDPCSFAVSDIPFMDGLAIQVSDANDGDGNSIDVWIYVREEWRQ